MERAAEKWDEGGGIGKRRDKRGGEISMPHYEILRKMMTKHDSHGIFSQFCIPHCVCRL